LVSKISFGGGGAKETGGKEGLISVFTDTG